MIEIWSSVELGSFADALCNALGRCGLPTRQRFLIPKQEYWAARGTFGRVWLRAKMYFGYPLLLGTHFLFRRTPPISIVTSNTFYAPWLAMRLTRGRRKVIHLVYDLYPDALVVAGKIRSQSRSARLMRRLTKDTFRRASANVFLGQHLLEYAQQQYGAIPHATVIAVGSVEEPFREGCPVVRGADQGATILYCGNLGKLHEIDTLVGAVHTYRQGAVAAFDAPLRLRLQVSGPGVKQLKEGLSLVADATERPAAAGLAIEMGGELPEPEWVAAMQAAEVALVTLAPGAEHVSMPSKTYSALLAGQAILAICAFNSDLAELVLKHDCGWVVVPNSATRAPECAHSQQGTVYYGSDGLLDVLREIAGNRAVVDDKRRKAHVAGHKFYAATVVANQWAELIRRM